MTVFGRRFSKLLLPGPHGRQTRAHMETQPLSSWATNSNANIGRPRSEVKSLLTKPGEPSKPSTETNARLKISSFTWTTHAAVLAGMTCHGLPRSGRDARRGGRARHLRRRVNSL